MELNPATSIYLNDFRMDKILEVVNEIKSLNIDELLINYRVEENRIDLLATLSYTPMFHRVEINYFEPNKESLYPNPDVEVLMMPKATFVKNLAPNDVYDKLINP